MQQYDSTLPCRFASANRDAGGATRSHDSIRVVIILSWFSFELERRSPLVNIPPWGITRKRGSSAALQSSRLEDGDLSQDFCEVDLRNHGVDSAYGVEIDGVLLQPSPSDAEIFVEILHRDREIKNKRQTPVEPCC